MAPIKIDVEVKDDGIEMTDPRAPEFKLKMCSGYILGPAGFLTHKGDMRQMLNKLSAAAESVQKEKGKKVFTVDILCAEDGSYKIYRHGDIGKCVFIERAIHMPKFDMRTPYELLHSVVAQLREQGLANAAREVTSE